MTTIRAALARGIERLTGGREVPGENPRLDAQVLLSAVLERDRSYLYMAPEQELTPAQEARWWELLARREQGEPVAYVLGQREFYGLDLLVDPRVLIPRPETELLVETALRDCQRRLAAGERPLVADIGTGSGAIPIALAVEEPRLPLLYACDISSDALEVAAQNCQRHGVSERVRLRCGDLLEALPEPVDVLLANLPYVGTKETGQMTRDVVEFEPHLALFSGHHGLDLIDRFLRQAAHGPYLRPGALMLLEIGFSQHEAVAALARELWPEARVSGLRDLAGWDRIVRIEM